MLNLKKLKLVKDWKAVKPRFKWLMFSQIQDYKINSNYVDLICSDREKSFNYDNDRLESMVRETLIKEFTPEIQNIKSYDFLVDAVVHNIKKKQLREQDALAGILDDESVI